MGNMDKREGIIKINRKEYKAKGKKSVKRHYWIFLLTCLIGGLIGAEFADSLTIFTADISHFSNIISIPNYLSEGFSSVFSTDKGVLSSVLVTLQTGTYITSLALALFSLTNSEIASAVLLVVIAILVLFAFWFYVGNVFKVISRRIFLEGRNYGNIPAQRFLYLFYIKRWSKVAWAMCVTTVFNALWFCLFIVGGVIKRYSYYLVPFILAENPDFKPKEAITLSRNMMDGYKMQLFVMELSFLGWAVLSALTLGLSGLFFSNPYQISAFTEFYVEMRERAKENNIPNADKLNDTYLYEKASKGELEKKYADVVTVLNEPAILYTYNKSNLEKAVNMIGISIFRKEEDELRELQIIKETNAREFEQTLNAEQYPTRLFTVPEKTKNSKSETVNFMRRYTIPSLIIMFFAFSFVGWSWEVLLHIIRDGVFVNRGTMHGPWLPIYGGGGLLILTLLYQFRRKPIIQFVTAVVLCGIVEYATSYYLEIAHDGQKWWDYSGYLINFNGRVCAEGLIVFGLGGLAMVYVLAPLVDSYVRKINHKVLIVICCVLLAAFIGDSIYSKGNPNTGKGISSGDVKIENMVEYEERTANELTKSSLQYKI